MPDEYDGMVQREIVTTRVFDAPRELVFEAWTDPEQLKRWWVVAEYDARAERERFREGNRFVEIAVSERIVLDRPSQPRFRVTVLFEELGVRTKVTFRQLFETSAVREQIKKVAVPGNEENFDRLAALITERQASAQA